MAAGKEDDMISDQKAGSMADLDQQIERMAKAVEASDMPSLMDAAVVAVLRDDAIREALEPILEAGGLVKGIVVGPAGTVDGVVQLEVTTDWWPGTNTVTAPPIVSSIIHLDPPRVIEVITREGEPENFTAPLTMPTGRVPAVLRGMERGLTPRDFEEFAKDRRSIIEWLNRERLDAILESLLNPANPGGAMYSTSGTKCSSWFCFEKTKDDSDIPGGSADFAAPPRTRGPFD